VKAGLATGVRRDSTLFGIKLGSTREEFYGTCFDLNKQKLVTQGVGFSVQYDFVDSITQSKPTPVRLMFYPGFDTLNVINAMNVEFTYPGWSPGIRELQSDSLSRHVKRILKTWYGGNDFVSVEINKQEVPVKVDGNRRILVFTEDDRRVLVRMQDMSHPEYLPKGMTVHTK